MNRYAVFENLGGTRDIVFYYETGGADSVTGINAAEADYIVDLLRNEKPLELYLNTDGKWGSILTKEMEPVGEGE